MSQQAVTSFSGHVWWKGDKEYNYHLNDVVYWMDDARLPRGDAYFERTLMTHGGKGKIVEIRPPSESDDQVVRLQVYWDASIPAAANGIPEELHEELLSHETYPHELIRLNDVFLSCVSRDIKHSCPVVESIFDEDAFTEAKRGDFVPAYYEDWFLIRFFQGGPQGFQPIKRLCDDSECERPWDPLSQPLRFCCQEVPHWFAVTNSPHCQPTTASYTLKEVLQSILREDGELYQHLDFGKYPNVLKVARAACSDLVLFGPSSGRWDLEKELQAFHGRKGWILAAADELRALASEAEDLESAAGDFISPEVETFLREGIEHEGAYNKYRSPSSLYRQPL
ncbi:uncharacterized protein EI90DRAFT_3140532 [Cantharellus anzutake]|uniref:uncharacterized protein n=1 Tax=Cantharellus anzutake TaxID=1750568 RepID=UPI001904BA49|nr:uncharacterized protein EI90DRAFT_3140532 [Cantharellus anzutake]KAF8309600.1 hypothetical protein EI90DRAFT_3140532 [Cantharellus anzutake]